MKTRPVGAELFHTDRQTHGRTDGRTGRHDEVNSRFSEFCDRTLKSQRRHNHGAN
jgi:hypothetical protein